MTLLYTTLQCIFHHNSRALRAGVMPDSHSVSLKSMKESLANQPVLWLFHLTINFCLCSHVKQPNLKYHFKQLLNLQKSSVLISNKMIRQNPRQPKIKKMERKSYKFINTTRMKNLIFSSHYRSKNCSLTYLMSVSQQPTSLW